MIPHCCCTPMPTVCHMKITSTPSLPLKSNSLASVPLTFSWNPYGSYTFPNQTTRMKLFPGSVTNKARSIQGFRANPLDANKKAGFWVQEIVYRFRNSEGRLDLLMTQVRAVLAEDQRSSVKGWVQSISVISGLWQITSKTWKFSTTHSVSGSGTNKGSA